MIFWDTLMTSWGPHHVLLDSQYTITLSLERINYWIADLSSHRNAILILVFAVIVLNSDLANRMDWKRSGLLGLVWEGVGKSGIIPSTSRDGIRAFGLIVPFIA